MIRVTTSKLFNVVVNIKARQEKTESMVALMSKKLERLEETVEKHMKKFDKSVAAVL